MTRQKIIRMKEMLRHNLEWCELQDSVVFALLLDLALNSVLSANTPHKIIENILVFSIQLVSVFIPQNIMPYDNIEWTNEKYTFFSMSVFNICLKDLITYETAFSLDDIMFTWLCHVNLLSIINHRNLVSSLFASCLLSYFSYSWVLFEFFVRNWRKCVFSRFNTSKLLWNHVFNLCINSFTSFPNFRFSGFETIRLVSSANKIGVDKSDIEWWTIWFQGELFCGKCYLQINKRNIR